MDGAVNYGRLLIFFNTSWYSVCQSGWTAPDAYVACNQMGMDGGSKWDGTLPTRTAIGILHTDVKCSGTESGIEHCQKPANAGCSPPDTVALQCTGDIVLLEIIRNGEGKLMILSSMAQSGSESSVNPPAQLKVYRPCPRDPRRETIHMQKPPDYRHTDQSPWTGNGSAMKVSTDRRTNATEYLTSLLC